MANRPALAKTRHFPRFGISFIDVEGLEVFTAVITKISIS
jgi:hypothetical protein